MTRKVPRTAESEGTGYGSGRARLLVAAEKLFGERGIDNVSLRQVGVVAGQSNNSAIALHFGTKDGLIGAILEARRPVIDAIRQDRLQKLQESGKKPTLRDLLCCLMMPWADDVDAEGGHPYACFIAQLMWSNRDYYPLSNLGELPPAAAEVVEMIRAATPHLEDNEFSIRLRLMTGMFLTAVVHRGKFSLGEELGGSEQGIFERVLDIAALFFASPNRLNFS